MDVRIFQIWYKWGEYLKLHGKNPVDLYLNPPHYDGLLSWMLENGMAPYPGKMKIFGMKVWQIDQERPPVRCA